ncbi:MAG: hypothetical protein R3F11_27655 [Verrucomicrobiales bacterium]
MISFELSDPPELSDNSGAPIDLGSAGRSPSQRRGEARIPARSALRSWSKNWTRDQPRRVAGVAVDDRLDPGASLDGTVGFNAVGATAGVHRQATADENGDDLGDPVVSTASSLCRTSSGISKYRRRKTVEQSGRRGREPRRGGHRRQRSQCRGSDRRRNIRRSPRHHRADQQRAAAAGSGIQVNDPIDIAFTSVIHFMSSSSPATTPTCRWAARQISSSKFTTPAQYGGVACHQPEFVSDAGKRSRLQRLRYVSLGAGWRCFGRRRPQRVRRRSGGECGMVIVDHTSTFRISVGASTLPREDLRHPLPSRTNFSRR